MQSSIVRLPESRGAFIRKELKTFEVLVGQRNFMKSGSEGFLLRLYRGIYISKGLYGEHVPDNIGQETSVHFQ